MGHEINKIDGFVNESDGKRPDIYYSSHLIETEALLVLERNFFG